MSNRIAFRIAVTHVPFLKSPLCYGINFFNSAEFILLVKINAIKIKYVPLLVHLGICIAKKGGYYCRAKVNNEIKRINQ